MIRRRLSGVLLLTGVVAGYVAGRADFLAPQPVLAQQADSLETELSEDATDKLRDVYSTLTTAASTLESDGRYKSAIQGTNAFAISVGGIDAVQDLEEGGAVDPETFAGLYAGIATEDIQQHLAYNSDNQLTYKGKLIRMYSTGQLKRLYGERLKMLGVRQ